jgi:hypothetical protein
MKKNEARQRRRRQFNLLASLTAIMRLCYGDWFEELDRDLPRLTRRRARLVRRRARA